MKKTDLISIIIPIYNIKNYVRRCVDSVLGQTYSHMEIILVDDGSTDGSESICDIYQEKDSRIRVIHQKNGGLSNARNSGIKIAKGKYITFIDGDDYVSSNMIEVLYRNMLETNSDISICSFLRFYDDSLIKDDNYPIETKTFNNADALKSLLLQQEIMFCAWGKLYKTSLFRGVEYPDGKICEDVGTTYILLSKSQKIVWSNERLYYYLQRSGSIIHSAFTPSRLDALQFCEDILKYVNANFPQLINYAKYRYFAESIFVLERVPIIKKYRHTRRKIFQDTIKKYRKTILCEREATPMMRVYALTSYGGLSILSMAVKAKTRIQRRISKWRSKR